MALNSEIDFKNLIHYLCFLPALSIKYDLSDHEQWFRQQWTSKMKQYIEKESAKTCYDFILDFLEMPSLRHQSHADQCQLYHLTVRLKHEYNKFIMDQKTNQSPKKSSKTLPVTPAPKRKSRNKLIQLQYDEQDKIQTFLQKQKLADQQQIQMKQKQSTNDSRNDSRNDSVNSLIHKKNTSITPSFFGSFWIKNKSECNVNEVIDWMKSIENGQYCMYWSIFKKYNIDGLKLSKYGDKLHQILPLSDAQTIHNAWQRHSNLYFYSPKYQ